MDRRRRCLVAVLLLGFAGVSVGAGVAIAAASRPGSVYGRPAVNRAIAHRAASALLAAMRPPAGASVSGDVAGRLARPGYDEATPNLVDAHRWYTTSLSPAAAIAAVARHLPRGVLPRDGGTEGGPGLQERNWGLQPLPGLTQRLVSVSTVALASGRTLVRLDGEAVWLSPRSTRTRIALGAVRSATFSGHGQRPGGGGALAESLPRALSAVDARALAARLNADALSQPGVTSCPAAFAVQLTVALRGAGGRLIARAVESPTGCPSIALAIGGGPSATLQDGGGLTGGADSDSLSGELLHLGAIPRCDVNELGPGTASAHERTLYVTLRNRSRAMCSLRGIPRLALAGADGATLTAADHAATSGRGDTTVVLYPGTLTEFSTTFTSCPRADRARSARVRLPGATASSLPLSVAIRARVTPCHGGPLDVSALFGAT